MQLLLLFHSIPYLHWYLSKLLYINNLILLAYLAYVLHGIRYISESTVVKSGYPGWAEPAIIYLNNIIFYIL